MSPEMQTEDERNRVFGNLLKRMAGAISRRFGRERAQDMAQRLMMVLLRKYPEVKDETELTRLAFKIKGFISLEELADMSRSVQEPEDGWRDLADSGVTAERAVIRRQLADCLAASILKLGERCRELIAYRLRDLESTEISKRLKLSVSTLYVTEMRCNRRLKEIMVADCGVRGARDAG